MRKTPPPVDVTLARALRRDPTEADAAISAAGGAWMA